MGESAGPCMRQLAMSHRLLDSPVLQLVAVLQPLATAACGRTTESSCVSGCVLPDDSSGSLHLRGVRIHSHVD